MKGSGCFNCPVKNCETMNYRGSTCAAQRAKFGLGDPMTNADRIRAMTDQELVKLISSFSAFSCIFPDKDCEFPSCVECVEDWLFQSAEGMNSENNRSN